MSKRLSHLYVITNKINNMPHRKPIEMIDLETGNVLMVFDNMKEVGRWLLENGESKNKNIRSIVSTIGRAIKLEANCYGYKWREIKERQSTIETTS